MRRPTLLVAACLLSSGCLEPVSGTSVPLDERFTSGAPEGGLDGGSGGGDTTPFAGLEGPTVVLSGTVVSEVRAQVDLDFRVRDEDAPGGRRNLGKLALPEPGEFQVEPPAGLGELLIEVFQDLAGDGPSEEDPYGWVQVTVGQSAVTDLEVLLVAGGLVTAREELASSRGGLAWKDHAGEWVSVTVQAQSDRSLPIDLDLRHGVTGQALGKLMLQQPGELSFEAPSGYGPLRLQAFQDLDDDGPTDGDPFDWTDIDVAGADLTDILLTLEVGRKLELAAELGHSEQPAGDPAGEGEGDTQPPDRKLFPDHEGPRVVLSGTVTASDAIPLDLDLRLVDPEAPGGNVYGGKVPLERPGDFSFEVPAELGGLSIQAFQDQTGDGPTDDDPFGFVELVVGTSDVSGLSIEAVVGGKEALAAQMGHDGGVEHDDQPREPALFGDHAGPWTTLSGSLTGAAEGQLAVDVRVPDPEAQGGNRQIGKTYVDAGTSWSLKVPRGVGTLILEVFQDTAGDGPSSSDPFATATVKVGDTATLTVDLALVVGARGQPSGGGGGVPGQPAPPSGGGTVFSDLGSSPVTLTGEIVLGEGVADAIGSSQIDLDVFGQDAGSEAGRTFLGKLKLEAGTFRFKAPEGVGDLELEAYVDLDADGPTPGDPFGVATPSPIRVEDEDIPGIRIEMQLTSASTLDD